jgi:hypothetical protein
LSFGGRVLLTAQLLEDQALSMDVYSNLTRAEGSRRTLEALQANLVQPGISVKGTVQGHTKRAHRCVQPCFPSQARDTTHQCSPCRWHSSLAQTLPTSRIPAMVDPLAAPRVINKPSGAYYGYTAGDAFVVKPVRCHTCDLSRV